MASTKDILKIDTTDQWHQVLQQYQSFLGETSLMQLKEHKRTLDQTKGKVLTYMRKQLLELNNQAKEKRKKLKEAKTKVEEVGIDDIDKKFLRELIELLLSIDRELPANDFFSTHGEELFNILFKLTFYNDVKYSISNT